MDLLKTLSNEDKLELISELVKSMKKAVTVKKEPKDVFARFSSRKIGVAICLLRNMQTCFVVRM